AERDPPAGPSAERSAVTWRALYRGRRLSQETAVHLHPVAEAILGTAPRPEGAGVAVRAEANLIERYGVAQGALAVVVDCSGSMGPPEGKAMTESTRYRQVTRALRTVLARVPRGTNVSVWVFGQAVGGEKAVGVAERTIERIQSPIRWDRSKAQLDAVMRKLEVLEPWNESPIVRAMFAAKADLDRAAGF